MATNIDGMADTIAAWLSEQRPSRYAADDLVEYLIDRIPYEAARSFWARVEGREKLARKDRRLAKARERAMLARRSARERERDVPVCGFSDELCVVKPHCPRFPNGLVDCKIRRDTTK